MSATIPSVIGHQPKEVQAMCSHFTQSYNKHRKTIAEWGRLLQAIRDSNLNPVDADGKPIVGKDVEDLTFSAICRELGVPRSTAYYYINIFLVTSTYPEWLQEAATASNLNLAAQHVQDAFDSMRETIPAKPDILQVAGVVAQLKKTKAPSAAGSRKKGEARFLEMLQEAFAYAAKNNLLEKAIAARFAATPAQSFTVEQALEFLKAGWKPEVAAAEKQRE
jgi:hypothetical protein